MSVRARLTATVVFAITVLGGLALVVGVGVLEDRLIRSELDRAGDEVAELAVLYLGPEEVLLGDLDPLDGVAFGDVTFFGVDGALEDVPHELAALDDADLYEPLATAASGAGDRPVVVATVAGLVEASPERVVTIDESDVDGRAVVIEDTLFETLFLVYGGFAEPFGGDDGVDASSDIRFARRDAFGVELVAVADVGDTVRSVEALRDVVIYTLVAAVALGGLGAWILAGRALRPVRAITGRVEEISSGTLHERVPEPAGRDEIADLASTMNAMLDRIESGDRKRRQFVADASHELRTPVALLRSDAELALRHPDRLSEQELASTVLAESERLSGMVADLLTLARHDEHETSARDDLRSRPVDLDDIVLDEAHRTRRVPIETSGVGAAQVRGSGEALQRAIGHLLDDAARHATAQIAVGVGVVDGWAEVVVDDDGSGIAPADRDRIFEQFTRLDDARDRDRGGSGLGLAVVAAIVDAHRGTVAVSDSPTGGARFAVRLPVAG